jgi:predicted nucleotidyltransferase
MPITDEDLKKAKEVARQYGASRLIVFGRSLEKPEEARDLDLAVEGIPGWGLWRMAAHLEEALSVPLDVVPLEPANEFTRRIEERGEQLLGPE